MRFVLVFFTALLTLAAAAVVLRALPSFPPGAISFGAVVGGASGKLLGLLFVLSVIFIILLVVYRRRERRKRT